METQTISDEDKMEQEILKQFPNLKLLLEASEIIVKNNSMEVISS